MEGISIRHAVAGDARQIAIVHVDSWRATYTGLIDPEVLSALSYDSREARWLEWIAEKKSNILVAQKDDDGKIIGFCSSGPTTDRDPRFSSEIYALYLLPEYQRKGIGRELVRLTASQLITDGFNSAMTWVLADNPSRKFYESLGGKVIRSRAITIGSSDIEELNYGWDDLKLLQSGRARI